MSLPKLPPTTLTDAQMAAWRAAIDRLANSLPDGATVNESQIRRDAIGAWVVRQGVTWPGDPQVGGRRAATEETSGCHS